MTKDTDHFDMSAAPIRIGTVRLKVCDLDSVSAFYQNVLGLLPIETDERRITLGSGKTPLLDLESDPAAAPRDPRQAGLFHTAFLMPTRADLARWTVHADAHGIPLLGASDHIVSEALYLADPEGNGIEVYADRPISAWSGDDAQIRMTTEPLDMQDLMKSAEGTDWAGFPEDGIIGHVHLQVGDTQAADRFYRDIMGFDVTVDYPGASFYGSGGYHHQLAGNVWNSHGAGVRTGGMVGLDRLELLLGDASDIDFITDRARRAGIEVSDAGSGPTLRDPWGTAIALVA